jgi:hypothetical protein
VVTRSLMRKHYVGKKIDSVAVYFYDLEIVRLVVEVLEVFY